MKRIKELRLEKNITQQTLADVLHVTQQSVFKYEHDLAVPDIDILIACANYFDTTVDYLVENSDISRRYEDLGENSITPDERKLLEYYRQLSDKAQQLIQELLISPHPDKNE